MMGRILREEKGTVLIMATMSFTVALLILVLLIDIGQMHIMRARLQTAIDAGTLAAVHTAKVEATQELRPNLVTRFFAASEWATVNQLAAEHRIQSQQEVWGTRTYWDPKKDEWVTEDVLEGWYVTYRDGWKRVVTRVEPVLDQVEADEAARAVIQLNTAQWYKGGVKVVGPILGEDSTGRLGEISDNRATPEEVPTEIRYTIPWAAVYVQGLLAGGVAPELEAEAGGVSVGHGQQEMTGGGRSGFLRFPIRIGATTSAARIQQAP